MTTTIGYWIGWALVCALGLVWAWATKEDA
jgi:hypothetical protein